MTVQSRRFTIRPIRLAIAAAVILPLLLFLFASWTSFRNISALADERLTRSLDIQQEEATKAFQLIGLTLSRAAELVLNMDGKALRLNEEQLHTRFAGLAASVGIVQSIWVYSPNGEALVTSSMHP